MKLLEASKNLSTKLHKIFPYYESSNNLIVYNVFEYAWKAWEQYVTKCAKTSAHSLMLGINPGPHGMVQTGIPFGNIESVKNYIGINCDVLQPKKIHPKKPVLGIKYTRAEPSGLMLWNAIKDIFPKSHKFFSQCFVLNYCPLAFFSQQGENKTPEFLPKKEQTQIETLCSQHLLDYITQLQITRILAVGKYSLNKALQICEQANTITQKNIFYLPHPSPLNRNRHQFTPTLKSLF